MTTSIADDYRRICSKVKQVANILEDECERMNFDENERRYFFDLLWDYAESAVGSRDRYSVPGWKAEE